jgi:hypothetical protein
LLDGGGEGKFALAALGDDRFQLMEAPRQYVFRFYRRGASLYVKQSRARHELRFRKRQKESRVWRCCNAFQVCTTAPSLTSVGR